MGRVQLLNVLRSMGIRGSDIENSEYATGQNTNDTSHMEFLQIIQRIRFNLTQVGFQNANQLNLEGKSRQFVSTVDLLLSGFMVTYSDINLSADEYN